MLRLKRVYDDADVTDGTRVLVDGLWPRGIRRSTAKVDIWMKEVAPSADLRKWFAHEESKWLTFKKKYAQELKGNPAFQKLLLMAEKTDPLTLVFSARDTEHNNAIVLLEEINRALKKRAGK